MTITINKREKLFLGVSCSFVFCLVSNCNSTRNEEYYKIIVLPDEIYEIYKDSVKIYYWNNSVESLQKTQYYTSKDSLFEKSAAFFQYLSKNKSFFENDIVYDGTPMCMIKYADINDTIRFHSESINNRLYRDFLTEF